jgi:hypothetical protein
MKAQDDDLKKLIIKLDELGLDFKITVLYDGYVCEGRNIYKDIQMILPAEENGWREFMKLKLEKKEEKSLISLFSKLIGYFPFCKYLKGENIVYEWKRRHQEERFHELIRISNKSDTSIIQIEKL